tara:strand:+ start:710 stop:943 length:234 start_codon:yes stop_codon:yes gene_type:complete
MIYYILGGIGLSVIVPLTLFELGKCHMKRELRKNIVELEKIKADSNEDLSALIEIHFEELKKMDESLFVRNSKNKNL